MIRVKDIIINKNNKSQIKILGAYGTKAKGFGTSSFYLNDENVIDAGNLLNGLGDDCAKIQNIWLTHSHLDHICDIAYLIDNYFDQRRKTLNIMGLPQTLKAIKENFLNNIIWPDFSTIKLRDSDEMAVNYIEIDIGSQYTIGKDQSIKAYKTDHSVPSCGYIYKNVNRAILITADTYSLESTFHELENDLSISSAIIECSFPNRLKELAFQSKHLTPEILFQNLKVLKREKINLYINHIKPSYINEIIKEIEQNSHILGVKVLKDKEIVNF